jgi:hypothetical protein
MHACVIMSANCPFGAGLEHVIAMGLLGQPASYAGTQKGQQSPKSSRLPGYPFKDLLCQTPRVLIMS